MNIFAGIMTPFIGITAGAACVFFLKDILKSRVQKAFPSSVSGVMAAASVWSLLIPPMDTSEHLGKMVFAPVSASLLLDIGLLLLLSEATPHLHIDTDEPEGPRGNWKKSTILVLAVTLHNIPGGMAAGVTFVRLLSENSSTTITRALALSVGIAIQNFPEGATISLPLKEAVGKKKALVYGILSGIVEPIGALLMLALSKVLGPALPYFLSSVVGVMIYVVVEELIPEPAQGEHSDAATIGFAAGFAVTMILDVALG